MQYISSITMGLSGTMGNQHLLLVIEKKSTKIVQAIPPITSTYALAFTISALPCTDPFFNSHMPNSKA